MTVTSCGPVYLRATVVLTICFVTVNAQGIIFPGSNGNSNSGSTDSCVLPSGATGTCKLINDCPGVAQNLATQSPKICGYQGKTPVVCCTRETTVEETTTSTISTTAKIEETTVEKTTTSTISTTAETEGTTTPRMTTIMTDPIRLTDISPPTTNFVCGKAARITHPISFFRKKRALGHGNVQFALGPPFTNIHAVAGPNVRESTRNAWPWMALLGQDRDGSRFWFCSGVLLNDRWVLTAAHCPNRFNTTWVRLGEHDYSNNDDGFGVRVEDVSVAEVIYHPGYQLPEAYHDIALIRLARSVKLRREVRPVCLPWGHEADLPLEDNDVTITGWGARHFGGALSPVLNEVNVTVFQTDVCATSYSTLGDYKFNYPQGLGEESLCIGDNMGNDSCEGDSGGPAVLARAGRYTLLGIVSKGFGCGKKDFPGIYVRVQYREHLAWIKKVAF